MAEYIKIRGARQHNLDDIDLDLPRNALIVFTGVSGSGKSTLAFDTLFAEGQRLYLESLSPYARQFMKQMPRPKVDELEGLCPSIAISQAERTHNPRSTVATVTEIYDHLRVLYAAIGKPHCPQCGEEIGAQTQEAIIGRVLTLDRRKVIYVLAPVIRSRRGQFKDLLEDMQRRGFASARIDGEIYDISDPPDLDLRRKHDVEIVVDRIHLSGEVKGRVTEAVETAVELSEGDVIIAREGEEDILLSTEFACPNCEISFREPTHATFSFNSPQGMCPECQGLGETRTIVPELLVEHPEKSLLDGAIPLLPSLSKARRRHWYEGVADHYGFSLDTPWEELTDEQRDALLYGSDGELVEFRFVHPRHGWEWRHADEWEGIIPRLMWRFNRITSKRLRNRYEEMIRTSECPVCNGQRLKPESLAVTINGLSISDICDMTIGEAKGFFEDLALTETEGLIAEDALKEITSRLSFMVHVGLHYLTLDRSAPSLAGGEAQRVRLATQVGSGLVDCLYVLDEPSIGLHQRDQGRLLAALMHLRDLDNTVIIVEHDEQTMLSADYIVDFGPGAGQKGGEIVATGPPSTIKRASGSLTGRYLAGKEEIPLPQMRRDGNGETLLLRGARHNNLKDIDVAFPLGKYICITGVSGSGKSSLVADTLHPALAGPLQNAETEPGDHDDIEGLDHLSKVVLIDQNPIGRTPRSNPATYTKVFDHIRKLFSELPDSRARGYAPGRFSFNVPEGRCPECEGHGSVRLESDFLADVWVTCNTCNGQRFDRETLSIRYKGHNIADVLDMEVSEALSVFENIPPIKRILQTLEDVGLGYIKLGQPATTLSGGEAQRVKLARELGRPRTEGCLYILDEPTTGLHFEDIAKLIDVLQQLVDGGGTVVIVEHHPDIIKNADHVIDLGPEGGAEGGRIVVAGTPEEVAECDESHTGKLLQEVLGGAGVKPPEERHHRRARGIKTEDIEVYGAREHNLKNIDVKVPRQQFTVFSGVSGSGKTSLAMDTLYAEGQRRYCQSLSSYARQFVSQVPKPKVDRVSGLSPAVAIEQRNQARTPRSTVGTETQIYDYMRVLFARLGTPYCPDCEVPLGTRSVDDVVNEVLEKFGGRRALMLAPLNPPVGEEYEEVFERLARDGWSRVRVDRQVHELPYSGPAIDRRRHHHVELIVDRLVPQAGRRSRIAEAVERGFEIAEGEVEVALADAAAASDGHLRISRDYGCPDCGRAYDRITPRRLSFNHEEGWCDACEGLGVIRGLDGAVMIPNERLSIREGAVTIWPDLPDDGLLMGTLQAVAEYGDFSLDQPYGELTGEQRRLLMQGTDEEIEVTDGLRVRFEGLSAGIENAAALSKRFRNRYARALGDITCPDCEGGRVNELAANVRFRDHTLVNLCQVPIDDARETFDEVELADRERAVAGEIIDEVRTRLRFLVDIGLEYLHLHRSAPSLSGGEAQRVKLAGQLRSGLTGVMYVLDEPTVGIHPRDNERILDALQRLRDLGNTIMVVEHDPQTLEHADHIMDFGPGAGPSGGRVIVDGSPKYLRRRRNSKTADVLRGELAVPVPENRRQLPEPDDGAWLRIEGARHNNLQDVDVDIPLEVMVCVCGPSGSGKSSLIHDILYGELAFELHGSNTMPGYHRAIHGTENLEKTASIDQSPIGNTPRSNAATYIGVFDEIRELYSRLPEAKRRGYTPGRFSFNAEGGRCEACEGMGYRVVEMHFLPDVWVNCEQCQGRRYNEGTLEIEYRGQDIADVLEMSVDDAIGVFANVPRIRGMLQMLSDVGLGYLPLGQPAPTLSGGEAQRVKIARELVNPTNKATLYLLDEPTTGLHVADIEKLLDVLNRLVDAGHTIVIIEHNMDVVKTADYVIDLGPGGGVNGGRIVAAGRPEDIAQTSESETARYLKGALEESPREKREVEPYELKGPRRKLKLDFEGDAKRPWEEDGERWHTKDRVNEHGEEPNWHDEALIEFARQIADLPDADEPNWTHRTKVRFFAVGHDEPFAVARTDKKWYLQLQFRVPKGIFDEADLIDQLALPAWNELENLHKYGSGSRVRLSTHPKNYDRINVQVHFEEDVTKDAFREFLAGAWEAYLERLS